MKLNRLARLVPDGLLVDAAWMERYSYSRSLRSQYVSAGWLEQPARGVYKRPWGTLSWERAVLSLQLMIGQPIHVGGRTALDVHGFTHYVSAGGLRTIHLYGPGKPPGWLGKLPLDESFLSHRTQALFTVPPPAPAPAGLKHSPIRWTRSSVDDAAQCKAGVISDYPMMAPAWNHVMQSADGDDSLTRIP